MTYRSKILSHKIPKEEQELHIYTNPLSNAQIRLLDNDDYQAPLTANRLSPNSKWLIVRDNIHKIRSWGGVKDMSLVDPRYQDWYSFFQMRCELRRAQEHIRTIQQRPDFVPVRYFELPTDETHVRRYHVSHVKPTDVLYYQSFSQEPIVLQSLLYYFTEECFVPYNSIFRVFLSDICSVLYGETRHIERVAVLRKVALVVEIAFFIILGIMLFSLILSVLTTTSNFKQMYKNDSDGGIEWRQPQPTLETALKYL